jgi:hypothetical protein
VIVFGISDVSFVDKCGYSRVAVTVRLVFRRPATSQFTEDKGVVAGAGSVCGISGSASAARAVNPQDNNMTQTISIAQTNRMGFCRFIVWFSS